MHAKWLSGLLSPFKGHTKSRKKSTRPWLMAIVSNMNARRYEVIHHKKRHLDQYCNKRHSPVCRRKVRELWRSPRATMTHGKLMGFSFDIGLFLWFSLIKAYGWKPEILATKGHHIRLLLKDIIFVEEPVLPKFIGTSTHYVISKWEIEMKKGKLKCYVFFYFNIIQIGRDAF